jgi:2-polyprenyl-3-methyl-5-hydroxy-6-metoxy-1,4-benzoquinol methylase
MMEIDYSCFKYKFYYTNRATRSEFVVKQFGDIIGEKVLDVGSSDRDLEAMLKKYKISMQKYTSIDLNSKADISINLDKDSINLDKESYDTVVCTDVLEHLEKIHTVYDQLLTIANRNIIISLPNAWFTMKTNFFLKNLSGKYYGLPGSIPEDRHRWFFNISEAKEFIIENSSVAKKIRFYYYFGNKNKTIKRIIKFFLNNERYNNLFCPVIWVLIEK